MEVPERGRPETTTSGGDAGLEKSPDINFIIQTLTADYAGWQYSQVGLNNWLPLTLPSQVLQYQAPECKPVRTSKPGSGCRDWVALPACFELYESSVFI